jgi:hypothetical protein
MVAESLTTLSALDRSTLTALLNLIKRVLAHQNANVYTLRLTDDSNSEYTISGLCSSSGIIAYSSALFPAALDSGVLQREGLRGSASVRGPTGKRFSGTQR